MRMNRVLPPLAAAALAAMPFTASAQGTPPAQILIVDTATIYRTCTACVAAQTQLQAQASTLQQREQAISQPLRAESDSIEQAALAARDLTGAVRNVADQAIRTRIEALRTRQESANRQLEQLEQTLRSSRANVGQQIDARLGPILRQMMTARGANLVLGKEVTLASSDALEVTAEVLAALNQQLPSLTVAPLP
jgi:outer membrane protein